jgi:TRAP-type C4-dicarboxylate transport system substrate-binding protein
VIANKKAFDALDKATQAGLLKAAAEAEARLGHQREEPTSTWTCCARTA